MYGFTVTLLGINQKSIQIRDLDGFFRIIISSVKEWLKWDILEIRYGNVKDDFLFIIAGTSETNNVLKYWNKSNQTILSIKFAKIFKKPVEITFYKEGLNAFSTFYPNRIDAPKFHEIQDQIFKYERLREQETNPNLMDFKLQFTSKPKKEEKNLFRDVPSAILSTVINDLISRLTKELKIERFIKPVIFGSSNGKFYLTLDFILKTPEEIKEAMEINKTLTNIRTDIIALKKEIITEIALNLNSIIDRWSKSSIVNSDTEETVFPVYTQSLQYVLVYEPLNFQLLMKLNLITNDLQITKEFKPKNGTCNDTSPDNWISKWIASSNLEFYGIQQNDTPYIIDQNLGLKIIFNMADEKDKILVQTVGCLPVLKIGNEDFYLIEKRNPKPFGVVNQTEDYWNVISGHFEKREGDSSVLDAISREIKEELGDFNLLGCKEYHSMLMYWHERPKNHCKSFLLFIMEFDSTSFAYWYSLKYSKPDEKEVDITYIPKNWEKYGLPMPPKGFDWFTYQDVKSSENFGPVNDKNRTLRVLNQYRSLSNSRKKLQ